MNIYFIKGLLLPSIAIGLLLTSCKGKAEQQEQQSQQIPEFSVLTVSESNTTLQRGIPTTLEGENDIEIRPQISGFLTKVFVEEGQVVRKGQTLFQIDQVSLQAAVDAAQAAIAVAQANVNTAKTNMDNNKMLLDKNIISQPAYQTSVDSYNAAKAQLSQTQANLTAAKKNLSYSTVTAPASGVVGRIEFREGSLVSPSSLLTVLSDNSDMRATFSLNEKELLGLTDGGKRSVAEALKQLPPVTLILADGTQYEYPGKIISISGVIDQATGSVTAKALFPNPKGMLHSGNTGQIMLPEVHRETITVPQVATYEVQDMKFVYVVNDSNKVKSRAIQVAPENDGQNYIVIGGLQPGETIVTEGVGISVKEDMQIKPKK